MPISDFWHEALGHLAPSTMEGSRNHFDDTGFIPPLPQNFHCEASAIGKSAHKASPSTKSRTAQKAELIYSDLCRPFPVPSYGNTLYYISFTCDATRFCWVQSLRKKSEAPQVISHFVTTIENQENTVVRRFRTDNGGEYVNERLRKVFTSKGIIHELTPPYSAESIGVAERLNRTIGEGVRAMMHPIDDRRLWAEAVGTFVYTKNGQPHSALSRKTLYEAFHKTRPAISHLQPFGRECYLHILKAKRGAGSKLLPRAQKGLFVGYTDVCHQYRIFPLKRNELQCELMFTFHLPHLLYCLAKEVLTWALRILTQVKEGSLFVTDKNCTIESAGNSM